MILLTGANGELGTSTIKHLMKQNPKDPVAGLVRSKEKGREIAEMGAEIRIGDYLDKPSLDRAMEGVDTLLLISSSSFEQRVTQHENVIKAAKKGGVGHIIYTSILQADKNLSPLTEDHHATEKIIKDAKIPYTINRHTFYTEFFPMFLGQAMETGIWEFPSNGKSVNFAYRTEMAEALANILVSPAQHKKKIYEITSSNAYTLDEYASKLSEASGREITYKDVSIEEFVDGLKQAELPEDVIKMSKLSAITVASGALSHTTGDLKHLLGREPKSTPGFIREFAG